MMRPFLFISVGFTIGATLFLLLTIPMPLVRQQAMLVSIVSFIGGIIGAAIGFAAYYLSTSSAQRIKGLRDRDFSNAAKGRGGVIAGGIIVTISLMMLIVGLAEGRFYIAAPVMLVMGTISIVRGVIEKTKFANARRAMPRRPGNRLNR